MRSLEEVVSGVKGNRAESVRMRVCVRVRVRVQFQREGHFERCFESERKVVLIERSGIERGPLKREGDAYVEVASREISIRIT